MCTLYIHAHLISIVISITVVGMLYQNGQIADLLSPSLFLSQ